ncbi:MAG: MFS transporter [Hyphomicrobiales bacterium]|nr:MAG: MFS transporter [Hyphomicrobiales bacterium]
MSETGTTKGRRPHKGGASSQSRSGNRPRGGNRPPSHKKAQVGLAARRLAIDIIEAVTDRGHLLDTELDPETGHAGYRAVIAKDRALVRAMVTLTLRRLGQIDDALSRLIDKPLPKKAARVRHVLRVAAAQILFMDVADHAAVDLAVAVTAGDGRIAGWKGLVNGVARNLVRQREEILADQDDVRLNTADWLWARWTAAYGEETVRRFAAMHMLEPSLDISVKSDPASWAERLNATVLPTGSLRLIPKGLVEHIDGYGEGAWWVQDAAAALPARLLGDVSGLRVADLCAAPGGKTAQLASAGADVTAVDISKPRAERLRANLKRLGLKANVVIADLLDWQPDEPFDAILLDAPCSSTGTIRRHPDVALRKTDTDIAALADLQQKILDRALTWLKPGGLLVYCTCSLEPEEGGDQIAALLARSDMAERVPITPDELGGLAELVTPEGDMRTLPHHLKLEDDRLSGLDGFFAARLRRR